MDAESRLQDAQKNILAQTSIISWFAGIKSEVSLVESMKIAIDGAQAVTSTGLPAPELLKRYERYSRSFERARKTIGGLLHSGDHLDPDTYRELCKSFSEINMAKSGQKPATLLSGGGRALDRLLGGGYQLHVCNGGPVHEKGDDGAGSDFAPGIVYTQPFEVDAVPGGSCDRRFLTQGSVVVLGEDARKRKISHAGYWFRIQRASHQRQYPLYRSGDPPSSTKFEAERAVNLYLERVRQRLQDKLRIGIPTVSQVIYVSGNVQNGRFVIGSLPESLQPSVGYSGRTNGSCNLERERNKLLLFELQDLLAKRKERGDLYLQFLSMQNLSVGLYELEAGASDPQRPHTEDEVYYVLRGRGTIRVGNEVSEVKPGSIVFVAAGADHKFFNIQADLSILVFFAPAHVPS